MNTILDNTSRYIYGADFLEERAVLRSLPGVATSHRNGYMPVDIARNPRYQSDEDGWIHNPSQRVLKRRARRAERIKDRHGWLGTINGSLQEPVSNETIPEML
jgi:hypothetical protein